MNLDRVRRMLNTELAELNNNAIRFATEEIRRMTMTGLRSAIRILEAAQKSGLTEEEAIAKLNLQEYTGASCDDLGD